MSDERNEHPPADASSAPGWPETIVKAGLAVIPYIGGVLSTLVGDVAARRRERVTETGQYAIAEAGNPDTLLAAVQRDERLADMLVSAVFAASETAVEEKRRAMGRVVGRAARDDATIDDGQLMLRVLINLDAPEFHVLGRIADVNGDQDAVRGVAEEAPQPIVSALIAHGVVETVGTFGGGLAVVGLTSFGRGLLALLNEGDIGPED
jgi:hypothetical protein